MIPSAEQLLYDVLKLPESDRLQIAEALYSSLQPTNQPPLEEAWREVVGRRSAELKSGQVSAVPWEEVKSRLPQRTGG